MFKTLDVLVGFTLVMLIMSMAVTMITQFCGTWLLNLKGVALREVITRLLAMLDRGLSVSDARKIADHILRDPLIGQPNLLRKFNSLAIVVHREELVKLVLDFASAGDASKVSDQMNFPNAEAELAQLRNKMRASLARNGIEDPAKVLEAIRAATLQLEKTFPELSTSRRAASAMITHAASDFLAKVNNWFDQTIDRASDIFTVRIRIVTFVASTCVALFFQLNSFDLLNRLSVDDHLREQIVAAAIARATHAPPAAEGSTRPAAAASMQPITEIIKDSGADQLEEFGVIAFPKSVDEWVNGWNSGWPIHFIGIILSAALLSLGAPFWYSLLSNLVKLRSVAALKDDFERAERQTTQAPATFKNR